MENGRQ